MNVCELAETLVNVYGLAKKKKTLSNTNVFEIAETSAFVS